MRTYKIGVIQCDTQNDKGKNLDQICRFIDQAAAEGVELVTLPETMHCIGDNVGEGGIRKEPIPGYSINRLMEKAKEHQIYIHCGSIAEEREGEERYYNTTVLLNRQGEIVTKYRKLHTFDVIMPDGTPVQESARVCPGEELVTVDTELGCLGMTICYDLRFPELYRILAQRGAQVIFVPANFTMVTGKDHWEVLLRARAIENGCYIVAADQVGKKTNGQLPYGNSMVVDPWGTVIAKANDRACMFTAEIDLDYLDQIRNRIPSLANRRSDLYEINTKK